ncbi:MAG: M42 family metallopeptidase [Anaerolineae bacterium]|jgi:putative aminopeptidase FrvX|nr:M42 family metallopeptidase [Anaerolineae bacterium]
MTALTFNLAAMTQFLSGLLHVPSPTGYHREVSAFARQAFEALHINGLDISITRKGALLLTWRGDSDLQPVGITAHLDTLGFMVKEINSNGSLKLSALGGINWSGAEFENCTVRTHDDRRYRGTIILSNPSTHVNREAQRKERSEDTMELRLDLRATSRDEVRQAGIDVGDFVFLDPRVEMTETGFIKARFLDDKAGVAAIYGALLALKEAGLRPAQDTAILLANYEEVGHGGAAGLPAGLAEVLAIDMGAIGQGQNGDEFSVSICVKDGGGPYHFDLTQKLRRLAQAHDIPHRADIYLYYASDGTAYWRAGGEARVGLIGPGVASSHGYERTHTEALQHSAHLIARYLLAPADNDS